MKVRHCEIPGLVMIEPRVFEDARGFFLETFHAERYREAGISGRFVQDNFSSSARGTLRGLHYQIQHTQGKLIQVVRGAIFDVAVDLRRNSPTFTKWLGIELDDVSRCQFYVPPGFAHGFYVLSDVADVFDKCTDCYAPEHERTLLWNDPDIGIDWPGDDEPILSDKDRRGQPLAHAECFDAVS